MTKNIKYLCGKMSLKIYLFDGSVTSVTQINKLSYNNARLDDTANVWIIVVFEHISDDRRPYHHVQEQQQLHVNIHYCEYQFGTKRIRHGLHVVLQKPMIIHQCVQSYRSFGV